MKRIESKKSKENGYGYYKNLKTEIDTYTIFYRLLV